MPDLSPYLDAPYSRGLRVDPATLIASFEAATKGWRAKLLHASEHDWPRVVQQALVQLHARGYRRGQPFASST